MKRKSQERLGKLVQRTKPEDTAPKGKAGKPPEEFGRRPAAAKKRPSRMISAEELVLRDTLKDR